MGIAASVCWSINTAPQTIAFFLNTCVVVVLMWYCVFLTLLITATGDVVHSPGMIDAALNDFWKGGVSRANDRTTVYTKYTAHCSVGRERCVGTPTSCPDVGAVLNIGVWSTSSYRKHYLIHCHRRNYSIIRYKDLKFLSFVLQNTCMSLNV